MATATKTKSKKKAKQAPPSFNLKAGVTLIAYWVAWIPGVVLNMVFLSEAKRVKKSTGTRPPGMVFLRIMSFVFFWLPIVTFGALVALAVAIPELGDALKNEFLPK